jgi:hypothetical protein
MILRPKLEIALLTASVAVTRFIFRSHYLYDLDSVNFALGMRRFDPRDHQPHPPGYFLYVCLGRGLNVLFHDANLALVVLSILASCGVVIVIYKMTLDWFGPNAARFAGAIFLFSPLAWFHGTVALTYSVESFFSALLGYLCWRIFSGDETPILLTGVVLGVSAGVRPSSLLFLSPLFLFSLWKGKHKTKLAVAGVVALILTSICWAVPMLWASGGFGAYFDALLSLWRLVPAKGTVFNSSPATSIARAVTIVFIFFLSFGAASLAPLAVVRRTGEPDRRRLMFVAVWIAPALCFFTLIFLKFVNSGYLLLLAAPGCIWLGFCLAEWWAKSRWARAQKLGLVAVGAAANVFIFLASPLYCSYRSVRHFEKQLAGICQSLPQVVSAGDTLVVGFDSHFLGYRHAGYYLPGYLTLEYPEVKLLEGTRIFAMQGGDTRLLTGLPAATHARFVIFPLAEDAENREYLQKVMSKLPSRDLSVAHRDGMIFVSGPVSDLPLIFPKAPPATE